MKFVFLMLAVFAALIWWMLHGEPNYTDAPIAQWAVDDLSDMTSDVAAAGGVIDRQVSYDGNGSLRLDITEPRMVNLYKVWGEGENLSFRQLVYEAKVKTEHASGPVFLVMQAGVSGAPEGGMPVIGLDKAISGTNDWTTLQIWAGNGGNAKHFGTTLQIEARGTGTIWVDDVKLLSRQVH